MESGIEDADLRDVGKQSCDCIHALNVGRIVKRSEVVALSESRHHFRRQANRFVELLSAVHHSVTDCIQLIKALQHSIFASRQHLKDKLHTRSMLLDRMFPLVLLTIQFDGNKRIGQANLLDATTRDD